VGSRNVRGGSNYGRREGGQSLLLRYGRYWGADELKALLVLGNRHRMCLGKSRKVKLN